MNWPWPRFEAAYEAMLKRELVEELKQRKIQMTCALFANGNIDPNDRSEAISELEDNFEQSVNYIYGFVEEDDIDWDDEFFAPVKRSMDRLDELMPKEEQAFDAKVEEVVDWESIRFNDFDQQP